MSETDTLIKCIESYIECFSLSITEENQEFVDGVIYGLILAQEAIKGRTKNGNTEK